MDEETQKRNTDCVYFLASPLTCKKGNDCEYRHSESARINPRDCWYWLGGNCLNPTCAFRHPPLDGLSGTPTPATVPPSSSASLPASGTANKPKVPCFFFQQGYCVKGDKCPFVHGPFSGANLTSQKTTKPSPAVTEPQASGKQAVNETESNKDGKHPSALSFPKAVQSIDPNAVQSSNPMTLKSNNFQPVQSRNPVVAKANNFKASQSSNPVALQSNNFQAGHLGNPLTLQSSNVKEAQLQPEARHVSQSRSQPTYIKGSPHEVEQFLPEIEPTRQRIHDASRNRSRIRPSHPPEERLQNGLESEDLLGGSSPGFDVLVDDGPDQLSHREDADYYKHDMESGRDAINGRERNMHNKRELVRTGYYDAEFQYDHGAYEPYKNRGYERGGRKQSNAFDDRVLSDMGWSSSSTSDGSIKESAKHYTSKSLMSKPCSRIDARFKETERAKKKSVFAKISSKSPSAIRQLNSRLHPAFFPSVPVESQCIKDDKEGEIHAQAISGTGSARPLWDSNVSSYTGILFTSQDSHPPQNMGTLGSPAIQNCFPPETIQALNLQIDGDTVLAFSDPKKSGHWEDNSASITNMPYLPDSEDCLW